MDHEQASPWYDRPDARINPDGDLEIRASAARSCRRQLWYSLCEAEKTNPPDRKDTARMEAGKMLEPVLVHLMQSEGWTMQANSQANPHTSRLRLMPGVYITGTRDATGREPDAPAGAKNSVIEVKTRGNGQYNNWSLRGAMLATPDAVAQGAIYVWDMDPEGDLIIATMNRETMEWDTERIANSRLQLVMVDTIAWLAPLQDHYRKTGPIADKPPGRDFTMQNYQCQNCPYQKACYAGAEEPALPDEEEYRLNIEDATQALLDYEDAAKAVNENDEKKKASMAVIAAWYEQTDGRKQHLQGHDKRRTVSRIKYPDYKVAHKAIRELLSDEQKDEYITESEVNYVRVS